MEDHTTTYCLLFSKMLKRQRKAEEIIQIKGDITNKII